VLIGLSGNSNRVSVLDANSRPGCHNSPFSGRAVLGTR
jgi:hypothetical protein